MCDLPTYDLMREHSIVERVCLIYETENKKKIITAAPIIQDFIEGYHEVMEEKHIFPYIKVETDLVKTLTKQHKISRKITGKILAEENIIDNALDFVDMYRWHSAMENSVIFEEFKHTVPVKTQKKINDIFEKSEKELFGSGIIGKYIKILDDLD